VEILVIRYYTGTTMMSGGSISIKLIDDLEVRVFCAMVVRVYGSLGTQFTSSVNMGVVDGVMNDRMFSWA
jgi:hypothetical protein